MQPAVRNNLSLQAHVARSRLCSMSVSHDYCQLDQATLVHTVEFPINDTSKPRLCEGWLTLIVTSAIAAFTPIHSMLAERQFAKCLTHSQYEQHRSKLPARPGLFCF